MNIVNDLNRDPHRPVQVTYAVCLLYIFITISFLVNLVSVIVGLIVYQMQIYLLAFGVLIFFLGSLMRFFVAMQIAKGKNWARWLLVIGRVPLFITFVFSMQNWLVSGDIASSILVFSELLVTALVVTLLFQRPSSTWFKTGECVETHDIENEDLKPKIA